MLSTAMKNLHKEELADEVPTEEVSTEQETA